MKIPEHLNFDEIKDIKNYWLCRGYCWECNDKLGKKNYEVKLWIIWNSLRRYIVSLCEVHTGCSWVFEGRPLSEKELFTYNII